MGLFSGIKLILEDIIHPSTIIGPFLTVTSKGNFGYSDVTYIFHLISWPAWRIHRVVIQTSKSKMVVNAKILGGYTKYKNFKNRIEKYLGSLNQVANSGEEGVM